MNHKNKEEEEERERRRNLPSIVRTGTRVVVHIFLAAFEDSTL